MTKSEAAKLKAQFVKARQEILLKATSAVERKLFSRILEELFAQLGQSGGIITTDSGKALKLSRALEKVMEHFNKNENVKLVSDVAANMFEIGTLNQKYFNTFKGRADKLKAIYKNVDKTMAARIGITPEGKFVKGGYLDSLIQDNKLKGEILRVTRQSFAGKEVDVKRYLSKVREVIVGTPERMGGVSSHFRTFVHDAYSEFDNEYANRVAEKLKLRCALMDGGLIATSREFCVKHNGKVYTREEIDKFEDDPDLLLTKEEQKVGHPIDYNPYQKPGRWNCRHFWLWITDEEAIRLRPELKKILKPAA